MYNTKKTKLKILLGIISITISIIIIIYIIINDFVNDKNLTENNSNDNKLNAIKEKVQDFQKGNAASSKNDLECYVDILYDNLKLNVDIDDVYNILQSDGLKSNDYKNGLLSSISILSKTLNKNNCNVYKPLLTIKDYETISNDTIFNSKGLEIVFKNDKDPVGASYTEYAFLTFIYFLSNLYIENEEKNIIPLSNNLKLLNDQLLKANAFKSGQKTETGEIIIPFKEEKEKIIINITTSPNPGKNITKSPNKKPQINITTSPNVNNPTTPQINITTNTPYIPQINPSSEKIYQNTEKIYVPVPIILQDQYNYYNNKTTSNTNSDNNSCNRENSNINIYPEC